MVNQRSDLRILKNREWLIEQRKLFCREDLASILQCHSGSIAWAERVLTAEEKKDFVFRRVHKAIE